MKINDTPNFTAVGCERWLIKSLPATVAVLLLSMQPNTQSYYSDPSFGLDNAITRSADSSAEVR